MISDNVNTLAIDMKCVARLKLAVVGVEEMIVGFNMYLVVCPILNVDLMCPLLDNTNMLSHCILDFLSSECLVPWYFEIV